MRRRTFLKSLLLPVALAFPQAPAWRWHRPAEPLTERVTFWNGPRITADILRTYTDSDSNTDNALAALSDQITTIGGINYQG